MKDRYGFIDCVRGYAVLLVLTCHLAYEFPGLPYPVHRVVVMGWHGVQMFFIASAVTLMMSWRRQREKSGQPNARAFFVRRFMRIAPAYYFAAIVYFFLLPPRVDVGFWHILATLGFVNAWHPAWLPTIPGSWTVVPGGWSISVEFGFYALFPLLATWTTTFSRALILLALSLVIGVACDTTAARLMAPYFEEPGLSNFLYFWLPNEFIVFVLGVCLYFTIDVSMRDENEAIRAQLRRWSTPVAALALLAFAAIAWLQAPLIWTLTDPRPPTFVLVSLAFTLFIFMLSTTTRSLFVNPIIALIGRVSFSAYLWHFAALTLLTRFPGLFHTDATSWTAIIAYGLSWMALVPLVVAVSWASWFVIEDPMIRLGHKMAVTLGTRPA
jgi:peptidoglycan/LPS O-acetylase OafA/YrhL